MACLKPSPIYRQDLALRTYLDHQSRSEFINLASQIGCDGKNMTFVFYENQIRKLMDESHCNERRLEVVRASCVDQPREIVNLFLAPMKNMSTSQRIEKALDRLRQRYGVFNGLTAEPKIIAIRNGPKVTFNVALLKAFNDDLNTLEVFAYAHDEVEKLSGQLLLGAASRLPSVLKQRYLDYLAKMGFNLNHPGFDSLREFITHELTLMTSDYAQTFFKNDEKDKPRDFKSVRDSFRVRQVAVKSKPTSLTLTGSFNKRESVVSDKTQCAYKRFLTTPPPNCFIRNHSSSKHFLADCKKFANLSIDCKRQMIINAGRCLNCLSLGHLARDCAFPLKCRKWVPNFEHKHSSILHHLYKQSNSVNFGAAEVNRCRVLPEPGSAPVDETSDGEQAVVRKLKPNHYVVLLRTSAVRVINPDTGKSTLAYAQHDTAS